MHTWGVLRPGFMFKMWNTPTDKQLAAMPRLYATDGDDAGEKIIHGHFFLGGCDWYVAEYDPDDRLFFGYAILNEDYDNAEWGYVSYDELLELKSGAVEVDWDMHWKPVKAGAVEKIVNGGGC